MESSIPRQNTSIPSGNIYLKITTAFIGAHIIVTFGEEITFFQAIVNPRYYKAMAGSVLIAALIIEYIGFVNHKLDQRYNWLSRPLHRALMQLCLGVGVTGIIAFLLAYVYFRIRGVDIFSTLYLRFDFGVVLLLVLVMNMVFVLHFFYLQLKQARPAPANVLAAHGPAAGVPVASPVAAPGHKEYFLIYNAGKIIRLPAGQISYFFSDGDDRYVQTFDGKTYMAGQTLDQIELLLDDKQFFRANRKFLISFHAHKHYSLLEFGKLQLTIDPPFKEDIIVSQKRAKAFKEWLDR